MLYEVITAMAKITVDSSIALRISRVWVAPMKMPSSWNDQTPSNGASAAHGKKSRASVRVGSSTVSASITAGPKAAIAVQASTAMPAAHAVVMRMAVIRLDRFV